MQLEDAEDLWIACLLQAPHYLEHTLVGAEHLTERARRILEAIQTLRREGWTQLAPSQVFERARLSSRDCRTIEARHESVVGADTIKNAERFLLDAWIDRELVATYKHAASLLGEHGREQAQAYVAKRERELLMNDGTIHWSTPAEIAESWLQSIERNLRGEGPPKIETSFPEFDAMARHYPPETMTVIAGYTNDGKSTFAGQLIAAMAMRGVSCAWLSLEDRKEIPVKRMISTMLQDLALVQGISDDALSFEQVNRIRRQISNDIFQRLPLKIEYGAGWSADRVSYGIVDAARKFGTRVTMVDYLQCLKVADRKTGLSDAVKDWKAAAASVGNHLFVLSQLVRPATRDRRSQRPGMFMLKETGDIENSAEYIGHVWRPQHGDDVPLEDARIIVDKSKDGPKGELQVCWSTTRHCYQRGTPTIQADV